MNLLSWFLVGIIAVAFALALIYALRHKGCDCGGCSHDCAHCDSRDCTGKCKK